MKSGTDYGVNFSQENHCASHFGIFLSSPFSLGGEGVKESAHLSVCSPLCAAVHTGRAMTEGRCVCVCVLLPSLDATYATSIQPLYMKRSERISYQGSL